MRYKIGDRFRWIQHGPMDGFIMEMEVVDEHCSKILSIHNNTLRADGKKVGDLVLTEEYSPEMDDLWKYIGNFGKSSNFKEIYDILNG